ncbi:competence type IV pilus minor pilin ComGF [Bacillus sp. PS06]|uniref:competence type IV pilus minor pilin ComGF n=1 Tax=Bacillus sp. PS06 TaxID=2764176 RepID=UPI00178457C5|nr:competence type IV pilus minor pilin ComGF [Bacillus sp. PS06]MBD8071333.1 prepilin-type N-terminal cleavage/methylation domain-containing protein [Bacillus sp. PS06]
MQIRTNEDGFTLLEMLIALSCALIVLLLISPALRIMEETKEVELNQLEWEVFYQQTKLEVKEAKELMVAEQIVTIKTLSGQYATYELYGNRLRRRINNTGHEILLQNLSSIHFQAVRNGFQLTIVDLSGKTYSRTFFTYASITVNGL